MRIKNTEIAEKLGISKTAVSLAINNKPGVSEETRQKVLKMISDSLADTVPSAGKSTVSSGSILLSVHKTHGKVINDKPFFSNLVETIQLEAMRADYLLTITHYMPGQNIEQYMNYIQSLNVNGIIVMATELDQDGLNSYMKLNIPMILLDATFDLADVDSVALDNQRAIFRAFDYGYRMGHREIGFLKSSTFINNFGHHYDGYVKGIREYGLEDSNHPVISLPCTMEEAYLEMKEFLKHPPKGFKMPTLFLADLDYIALGAMKAVKEAGYKVPEDVSFIGYDDVSACEISDPPLTTTRVNRGDVGRIVMNRLIHKLKEPSDFYTTTQVSSKLIIRESVADRNSGR